MDANEMQRKAAACRALADAAIKPAAKAEWLSAAEQWDQLALEVDAWRKRADDDAVGSDNDKPR
jgi:hypothetical protein